MRIDGNGFPWAFAGASMRITRAREPFAAAPVGGAGERRDLLRLAELLGASSELVSSGRAGLAAARGLLGASSLRLRSDASLGLDLDERASMLRSSEEINTRATSFTPRGPGWSGLSTPNVTVGGEYDGSDGDQTLTFKVTRTGIVGTSAVRVDVFDEGGTRLDRLNFSSAYNPGTELALSNGLTLKLGAGLAVLNDTFEVEVSASVGTAFDPAQPFDGKRNLAPELEDGFTVVDGAFTLNGTSIAVAADDALVDVLARINASAAGVTATYDSASERVVFTHDTLGAAGVIELADDTSGLLAALKLDGAVLEQGRDSDLVAPLASLGLAGLTDGTLRVGDESRTLDLEHDSLSDVLDWLEGRGLEARYDDAAGRLELVSTEALQLEDGTSGFFSAVGLATGRHVPAGGQASFVDRGAVRARLGELASGLNQLLGGVFEGTAARQAGRLREGLEQALRRTFEQRFGEGAGDELRSRLGLDVRFGRDGSELALDLAGLDDALRADDEELAGFLLGDERGGGLLAALEQALRPARAALGAILDSRGLAVLDLEA